MASVLTELTMSEIIEEVLDTMYRATERPRQTVLAAAASDSDTGLTVDANSAARIAATDVLEFGRELMLVTSISGVTVTVSRGFNGTTAAAHANGAVGVIDPDYPRYQVDREVRRCFQTLQTHLPLVQTEYLYPESAQDNVAKALWPLDESTLDVLEVRFKEYLTDNVSPLQGRWEFVDWLPPEISMSGKALMVPIGYRNLNLIVTTSCAYVWTEGATQEADTIKIVSGGESLPSDFAAAKLFLGREVSRQEFDQIEEWSQVEASRRGTNLRMAQALWSRFYQRLDEVKGIQNTPRKLVYRRRPHRIGTGGHRWMRTYGRR